MAALKRVAPTASVFCIDKRELPGGCWHDFYPFVALHQPHTVFGVNGEQWDFKDPNVLAPRDDVLRHFQAFVQGGMPPGFVFKGGTAYVDCRRKADGSGLLEVRVDDGAAATWQARHVIDARGFDYGQHLEATENGLTDHCGPGWDEVDMASLPQRCVERSPGAARMFVLIGGGKSGTDAALWLAENKLPGDEVVMITGRKKLFFCRDKLFQTQPSYSLSYPCFVELVQKMVYDWNGSNATEVLHRAEADGYLISVGEGQAQTCLLGILSKAEKQRVEGSTRIISNDHFVGCEVKDGTTRVTMMSGAVLETQKEAVLVNCRSSAQERLNALTWDVHPFRPDGSVCFGSLLGFTGPTNYLMTILYVKGKLASMPLYGFSPDVCQEFDSQWTLEFMCRLAANMLNVRKRLGLLEMCHFTIDLNRWQPMPRQLLAFGRFWLARRRFIKKAEAHCRRLYPDPNAVAGGKSPGGEGCCASLEALRRAMVQPSGRRKPAGAAR